MANSDGEGSPAVLTQAVADAEIRHRLRTPLNHIIGYSELLLEEVQERGLDAMAGDLRRIHSAGRELLAIMDEIVSRRQTGSGSVIPVDHAAPVLPGDAGEMQDSLRSVAGDGGPVARLLVVDDDDANRDIVIRLLSREGYRVRAAGDGAEALQRLEEESPDLVLLDVMMPGMDGIETCRRIKEQSATRLIPVVIMTALGEVEDRVRGIRAGADDFLTKPVHRDELLARIQTSLRLKQTVETRLQRLRGTREYLAKFVPRAVIRQLDENPDAPAMDRSDQDMTAMFVDVSGYTRLSETLRQTADVIVEKYFSQYLDAILRFGGDITETSGDGLMAVFPGDEPRAHAVDAVSAALEILAMTEHLNARLEGIFDPIMVHIGINSGIAVIGPTRYEGASGSRWTYTALGPAINLAARIAGVAEGGMILVGSETARRISGSIATIEHGRHELKNVNGAVLIHRVVTAQR